MTVCMCVCVRARLSITNFELYSALPTINTVFRANTFSFVLIWCVVSHLRILGSNYFSSSSLFLFQFSIINRLFIIAPNSIFYAVVGVAVGIAGIAIL